MLQPANGPKPNQTKYIQLLAERNCSQMFASLCDHIWNGDGHSFPNMYNIWAVILLVENQFISLLPICLGTLCILGLPVR
jgi:hypothetical protein